MCDATPAIKGWRPRALSGGYLLTALHSSSEGPDRLHWRLVFATSPFSSAKVTRVPTVRLLGIGPGPDRESAGSKAGQIALLPEPSYGVAQRACQALRSPRLDRRALCGHARRVGRGRRPVTRASHRGRGQGGVGEEGGLHGRLSRRAVPRPLPSRPQGELAPPALVLASPT